MAISLNNTKIEPYVIIIIIIIIIIMFRHYLSKNDISIKSVYISVLYKETDLAGLKNIIITQNFLVGACGMPRYGYPHSKLMCNNRCSKHNNNIIIFI